MSELAAAGIVFTERGIEFRKWPARPYVPTGIKNKRTNDQSRALIVGDRVRWNNDINDQGTVTETNWAGVTIKWDNRGEQAILHNDMILVERATTKLM